MGSDQENHTTVRVNITGRVQGVWYRAWTRQEAELRHLDGWVRNRLDGSVEAFFCGPEPQVTDMIKVCHTGPPMARVDDIQINPAEPDGEISGQGFVTRDTC
jgi:acylphosphatase